MSPPSRFVSLLLLSSAAASACAITVVDEPAGGGTGGAATGSSTTAATTTATGTGGSPATSSSTTSTGGVGGSTGACTDPADQAVLASADPWPAMVACGYQFIGSEPDEASCILMSTGLSAPCAACHDGYVRCIIMNCLNACISEQASPACLGCRAMQCDPAFLTCSGLGHAPGT